MAKGRSYLLRNTTKARVKIGVVGSRAQLAYKELTKAAARGETTKVLRGIRQASSGAKTDGAKLKEGILAMADRVGVTQEQYNALADMEEDVLASMFETNDLTFEVFFNYEGIQKVNNTKYIVSDEKRQDVDFFIEQYSRYSKGVSKKAYLDTFANDVI